MPRRFVSFHYVLKDKAGKHLDSSRDGEPMMFLEGSSKIIPGLEAGIRSLKAGEKKQIVIAAADAYGTRDESLVMKVLKTELPQDEPLRVGLQFKVTNPNKANHVFRVVNVDDTHVTLDANHPLAGEDLFFDVEITAMREATHEDIALASNEHDCSKHTH